MSDPDKNLTENATVEGSSGKRILSSAANRALAEAEERRKSASGKSAPREFNGRGGLEPVRYGDWEIKGLTSDF